MKRVEKEKIELPEVLEFLKLSRTVNRQLQLFKHTKIAPEYMDILQKTVAKMKKVLETFIVQEKGD